MILSYLSVKHGHMAYTNEVWRKLVDITMCAFLASAIMDPDIMVECLLTDF